jgi:hypothetical protein
MQHACPLACASPQGLHELEGPGRASPRYYVVKLLTKQTEGYFVKYIKLSYKTIPFNENLIFEIEILDNETKKLMARYTSGNGEKFLIADVTNAGTDDIFDIVKFGLRGKVGELSVTEFAF